MRKIIFFFISASSRFPFELSISHQLTTTGSWRLVVHYSIKSKKILSRIQGLRYSYPPEALFQVASWRNWFPLAAHWMTSPKSSHAGGTEYILQYRKVFSSNTNIMHCTILYMAHRLFIIRVTVTIAILTRRSTPTFLTTNSFFTKILWTAASFLSMMNISRAYSDSTPNATNS